MAWYNRSASQAITGAAPAASAPRLKTFFGRVVQKLAVSGKGQAALGGLSEEERARTAAGLEKSFGASTDKVEGQRRYDEAVARQKKATTKGALLIGGAALGAAALSGAFSGGAAASASAGATKGAAAATLGGYAPAGFTAAEGAAIGAGAKSAAGLSVAGGLGGASASLFSQSEGASIAAGMKTGAGVSSYAPAGFTAAEGSGIASGMKAGAGVSTTAGGVASSKSLFKTAGDAASGLSAASTLMGARTPSMPDPESLPSRGDVVAPARIPRQFETRADDMARRARAAGALRGSNQADFLGSRPGVKKRGAARQSLYGI